MGEATQKHAQSTLGALWGAVGKTTADRESSIYVRQDFAFVLIGWGRGR